MKTDTKRLPPSAAAIREARQRADITPGQAAHLVHVTERTWRYWERGAYRMPVAAWELFQLKLAQMAEASA